VKKHLLIISAFLLLGGYGFGQDFFGDKEFIVTPGIGFTELQLGELSPKGILNFREIKFEERDGKSISCGTETYRNFWKTFYNKDLDLTFEFNSEHFIEGTILPNKKMYLSNITISSKGCSTDNFCIGLTTYKNVAEKYGPIPKHWKNTKYLKFDKKGIAFRFNNESTLIEIEIFKPRKI
jgi:hypothetical protein